MTDKEKVIKKLKEALDSLDITSNLRLILIQTIEYLQEEPVSDTQSPVIFYGLTGSVGSPKEEPVSEKNLSNVQRTVKNWKEPVNEELGDYINKLSKQFPEVSFAKLSRIAVRVAKWQKQQDKETIEVAEDHAMLAGMEKMKEQMMAKAVDGYVIEDIEEGNGDFLLSADYLPKSMGLKDQQRVKVIVIKED